MTGEQRRKQLLDIAEETFGEIGYVETTMDLVAQRAKVTKPVLYSHFGAKDKLLIAVIWRATHDLMADLRRLREELPSNCPPHEVLTRVVSTYTSFVLGRRKAFRAHQLDGAVMAETAGENDAIREAFGEVLVGVLMESTAFAAHGREGVDLFCEALVAITERFAVRAIRLDESPEETAALSTEFLWSGILGQLAVGD